MNDAGESVLYFDSVSKKSVMSTYRRLFDSFLYLFNTTAEWARLALTPSELSFLPLSSFLAGGLHVCADLVQPLHQWLRSTRSKKPRDCKDLRKSMPLEEL